MNTLNSVQQHFVGVKQRTCSIGMLFLTFGSNQSLSSQNLKIDWLTAALTGRLYRVRCEDNKKNMINIRTESSLSDLSNT